MIFVNILCGAPAGSDPSDIAPAGKTFVENYCCDVRENNHPDQLFCLLREPFEND